MPNYQIRIETHKALAELNDWLADNCVDYSITKYPIPKCDDPPLNITVFVNEESEAVAFSMRFCEEIEQHKQHAARFLRAITHIMQPTYKLFPHYPVNNTITTKVSYTGATDGYIFDPLENPIGEHSTKMGRKEYRSLYDVCVRQSYSIVHNPIKN